MLTQASTSPHWATKKFKLAELAAKRPGLIPGLFISRTAMINARRDQSLISFRALGNLDRMPVTQRHHQADHICLLQETLVGGPNLRPLVITQRRTGFDRGHLVQGIAFTARGRTGRAG